MLELEEFVWDLKSGFEILWANEYDKKACITYRKTSNINYMNRI